jgi:hypothetical protein
MSVGSRKVTVINPSGGAILFQDDILVVEHPYRGREFSHRKCFPPKVAVGPRRLDLETDQ